MPKELQPFSKKEIKGIEAECESIELSKVVIVHAQVPVDTLRDRRFLATIAADRREMAMCHKQIEELEKAKHLRGERRRSTIGNLKTTIATQTAAIKRLRGWLEKIGRTEERTEEGTRKYTACGICRNPIGRKTLFKNECPSDCPGAIARQAAKEESKS